ncbi:cytochrome c oxidase copper chaperone 1 [Cinnamomum micranthum f. kanehirae]|uniref:Cytochrome c oxidase copper chaperone 1 n=1 Tax=Cinnamomum micranthum f. kanehirae TaxID=337451 RepID=A0A3S3R0W6_9MAGN|nr:cytochrome c oxidase copper chaperone 1 [Cinnamomum micranthum f. kanehirae]
MGTYLTHTTSNSKPYHLDTCRIQILLHDFMAMGDAKVGVITQNPPSSLVLPESQNVNRELNTAANETSTKPKKKICCACPDTKRLRDECIVQHGEGACTKWIEAHLQCLRSEGFKV